MKELKYLFCNITWMKYYKGITDDDKPFGGGQHIDKYGTGGEVCNFAPDKKSQLFGYVEGGKRMNLESIVGGNANSKSEFEEDVFVIWTANHPKIAGTFVVGWYKNATVFRTFQEFKSTIPPCHYENKLIGFRIQGKNQDAECIPADKRDIEVPKGVPGGMGQKNIWYGKGLGKDIAHKVWKQSIWYADESYNLSLDKDNKSYFEGAKKETFGYTYERNPVAREECIKHWGYKCQICGFDFERRYGDIGKGFIHVHHKTSLSEISGEYEVNPIKDLIPVCPNCHAMIHRNRIMPALNIDEMKKILRENEKNK